jgi:hypothetical protein
MQTRKASLLSRCQTSQEKNMVCPTIAQQFGQSATRDRLNDRNPSHEQAARSSAKIMGDPLIIIDIFDPIRVSKLARTTKVEKFASTAITILKTNMISSNYFDRLYCTIRNVSPINNFRI